MVDFYIMLIKQGDKKIEDVPKLWNKKVWNKLKEMEDAENGEVEMPTE